MKHLFLKSLLAITATVLFSSPAYSLTFDLTGTIRDFHQSHVDMESTLGFDPGIVEETLGGDGKPVYAGQAGNPTTHGQAAFDEWYNDVAGVNQSASLDITLDNTITADANVYTYMSNSFFPIDNQLFGNEGNSHNYHFTYEIHSSFTYTGGEFFSFTGDDDLWVFINEKLVVDLGGVHAAMTGGVSLNDLSLTIGEDYSFDLFFAERHRTQSNFRIDTSIALQPSVVPLPAALPLYGAGLAVMGLVGWRRKRKAHAVA